MSGTTEMTTMEYFEQCTNLFRTLGDPARQQIILLLGKHGPMNVKSITEHSHLSRPAISHHLKLLKQAEIVTIRQQGTEKYYALDAGSAMKLMKDLIAAFEKECPPEAAGGEEGEGLPCEGGAASGR
ncbi:ArsR/SmtB family transcription factor [Paenibacillus chitinolyticus]